jgi:hypothetical protein
MRCGMWRVAAPSMPACSAVSTSACAAARDKIRAERVWHRLSAQATDGDDSGDDAMVVHHLEDTRLQLQHMACRLHRCSCLARSDSREDRRISCGALPASATCCTQSCRPYGSADRHPARRPRLTASVVL